MSKSLNEMLASKQLSIFQKILEEKQLCTCDLSDPSKPNGMTAATEACVIDYDSRIWNKDPPKITLNRLNSVETIVQDEQANTFTFPSSIFEEDDEFVATFTQAIDNVIKTNAELADLKERSKQLQARYQAELRLAATLATLWRRKHLI